MASEIGFGVVGVGSIGKVHAEAIRAIPGARLLAVCGRDAGRTAEFASQLNVTAYTNYEKFLAHPGLSVVNICTPSGMHADQGSRAAAAGKHVLVEKPIEITLERADRLIRACDEARVRLGVIFQSRFMPAVQRIRRAIDEGRFGRLMLGDAYVKWYRAPEYYAAGSWHGTLALDGGGALINQAIHTLDLLRWMMGPAETVFAMKGALRYPHIEAEDTLVGTIRFRNGALGVIEAATSVSPGFKRRIEISGERGTVVLDGDAISHWSLPDEGESDESPAAQLTDGSADPKAISTEGHRIQIEEMMRAVIENREPFVDGREGRKSLELVEALYTSASSVRPVNL
ncbi:MAG TPA: Gfo/Idh/MocA family oxidoreductase [Blastocatellia bacterium]|nr:Gfo/Idh/MocA family oxidoreductase [Blastocatellia bacterium]